MTEEKILTDEIIEQLNSSLKDLVFSKLDDEVKSELRKKISEICATNNLPIPELTNFELQDDGSLTFLMGFDISTHNKRIVREVTVAIMPGKTGESL